MSEDRLSRIWARQLRFNRLVLSDKGVDLDGLSRRELTERTKDFILHVEDELHEFLRELDWKMHRRSEQPTVRSNLLEEYVDVLKFFVGLGQIHGFSETEVYDAFERKSEVVEYRYAMERRLAALRERERVVGVDIDGVLNDYPACFFRWVAAHLHNPELTLAMMGNPSMGTIRDVLGPTWVPRLKDEYRSSGAKLEQGVRPGAKELLDGLRAAGFVVVLLSARPFWRFSRIYGDTLGWMERNELRSDAVLFHAEKHRKILESFPNLSFMVDDDPGVCRDVQEAGRPVVMVRSGCNVGVTVPGVPVAEDLAEVLRLITSKS